MGSLVHPVLAILLLGIAQLPGNARAQLSTPGYTPEQAADGKIAYDMYCAACHGQELTDSEFGPPLKGAWFSQLWGGRTVDELFVRTVTTMPVEAPRSLGDETYANILAYVLQRNGVSPGTQRLAADPRVLSGLVMPSEETIGPGVLLGGITLPPPTNVAPNPLDEITPVTDAMLTDAPMGSWLTWRRTNDASGYSPLAQINKANVGDLRVAWSWGLPAGPIQTTPLVHDGVIFARGRGDIIQAIDAVTGDLLWEYRRWLPTGVPLFPKKSFVLYGEYLYLPTSDAHVVALDVKTGTVVWDREIADIEVGFNLTGGPVAAEGVVMMGTSGRGPGGNYIVGLDAASGDEIWRFRAIPLPGDPGGDSWNGMPHEQRTGGALWGVGSYDPESGLVFFGPSPTYDTAPLVEAIQQPGITNSALYTNATVALHPTTGELAWHYQHMANDQWDQDWAFERHILKLPVDGVEKTVVATGGKLAIYDLLEADTGRYVASIDLGLQNIVTGIDPETGEKRTDPDLVPSRDRTVMICPNTAGGKNWLPGSYNPNTRILYVPLMEICMDLVPVPPGERGLLSTGVSPVSRPRPDDDGKYGRIQAINLETLETEWLHRQRAPYASGVLATAGGLVFSADLNRNLVAHDADTGEELWRIRLNDASNTAPVTYMVNGKQYLAVAVGRSILAVDRRHVVPEIQFPGEPSATLWVFELPGGQGE